MIRGIMCAKPVEERKYSVARIIWPSLIRMPWMIHMVVQDTTFRNVMLLNVK